MRSKPWIAVVFLTLACVVLFCARAFATAEETSESYKDYGAEEALRVSKQPTHWITADHSKHEKLKQDFESPEEVTEACLSCHNEAGQQVMQTIHWTWICPADPSKKMGKAGLTLNNFCIAIRGNEPRCTSCHAGYGWKDDTFDFTDQSKIDCLVCHDTTHTYKKFPPGAGYPVKEPTKFKGGKMFYPPDYNKIAQSVGRPDRINCGTCHFYGGGGDGVKHGDLDSSMAEPSKSLDVHMNHEGANFTCVRCHSTKAHSIAGRCYKKPAANELKSLIDDDLIERITCVSCHTDQPHEPGHKANAHTDKVACQTCHIPEFARVLPTKMRWDWSTAGDLKDGKPYTKTGPYGKHSYASIKGDFRWEKDVVPVYRWFDGSLEYTLLTDTIDPSEPVQLNSVVGDMTDPRSRIYPFKLHTGKQPYDKVNNTMVSPNLFSPKEKDSFWGTFDWQKAITSGMRIAGLDYSGEYGFVETEYYFPITHMVAPKEDALACDQCHSRQGRLANLAGFYMPGRDYSSPLDVIGWLAVIGSIVGVAIHGILRAVTSKK